MFQSLGKKRVQRKEYTQGGKALPVIAAICLGAATRKKAGDAYACTGLFLAYEMKGGFF